MANNNRSNFDWAVKAAIIFGLFAFVILGIILLVEWIQSHVVIFFVIAFLVILGCLYWGFRVQINTFFKNLFMPKPNRPSDIDKPDDDND
jgi:hypothetical protein